MTVETLFSSFKPIEDYIRLVETAQGQKFAPAVRLRAIDAFLMRHLAACFPIAPTVIDLAGDATLGASVVFWASTQPGIEQVLSLNITWIASHAMNWRVWVADALRLMHLPVPPLLDALIDQPGTWEDIAPTLNSLSPLMVLLAVSDGDPDLAAHLDWLVQHVLQHAPHATLLLLPLGAIGESIPLESALTFCRANGAYRLTLPREFSPFLAASGLGIVHRHDNPSIPSALERIRQLYDGNFNFLNALDSTLAFQRKEALADGDWLTKIKALLDDSVRTNQESEAYARALEAQLRSKESELSRLTEYIHKLEASIGEQQRVNAEAASYARNLETEVADSKQTAAASAVYAQALQAQLAAQQQVNAEAADYARNLEAQIAHYQRDAAQDRQADTQQDRL